MALNPINFFSIDFMQLGCGNVLRESRTQRVLLLLEPETYFCLSCEHHQKGKCLCPAESPHPGTTSSGIGHSPVTTQLHLGQVIHADFWFPHL